MVQFEHFYFATGEHDDCDVVFIRVVQYNTFPRLWILTFGHLSLIVRHGCKMSMSTPFRFILMMIFVYPS